MYKQILSLLLCIVMILSFSVVSFAEEDRIPEAGDHVFFGHYEQDNDLNNGPEPIEWRVLTAKGDKMLLISEFILDALPFNEADSGNTWDTCSLRRWLNRDFIDTAFTNEEANGICLTELVPDSNSRLSQRSFEVPFPKSDAKQGILDDSKNSEDYVFLLSELEVLNSYFKGSVRGDHSKEACSATAYAKSKILLEGDNPYYDGLSIDFMEEPYSPWWFRSPANSWHCAQTAAFCKFSDMGIGLVQQSTRCSDSP